MSAPVCSCLYTHDTLRTECVCQPNRKLTVVQPASSSVRWSEFADYPRPACTTALLAILILIWVAACWRSVANSERPESVRCILLDRRSPRRGGPTTATEVSANSAVWMTQATLLLLLLETECSAESIAFFDELIVLGCLGVDCSTKRCFLLLKRFDCGDHEGLLVI